MSLGGVKTKIALAMAVLAVVCLAVLGQQAWQRHRDHARQEAFIVETLDRLQQLQEKGSTLLEGKADELRLRAERAVTQWLAYYERPSDQVLGLIWRGRLHLLIVNQEDAVAAFQQALQLDPESHDARLYLAMALYERDPKAALDHLEVLWQRDRSSERVSYLLASCRRNLGQLKEAEQVLDEFLGDNPKHAGALLERGKIALDEGRPEEAERFLRRALAEAPKDAAIHLALGRCLHLGGKQEEAQRHQRLYQELSDEGIKRREKMLQEMRARSN
jgi:tetratricopeptide (TPR) repeat protein